jgi:predicted DCC family thiol-disulfide oxidoreductase YuxK
MKIKSNTNQFRESKGIVLFDGFCNLCSWSVQFIIKRDRTDYFRFASLQSDIAKQILSNFNIAAGFDKSVVLIENKNIYFKSTAALRISRHLKGLWKYIYYIIYLPRFIRDFVYDIVTKYRFKWFGKKDTCFVPGDDFKNVFL